MRPYGQRRVGYGMQKSPRARAKLEPTNQLDPVVERELDVSDELDEGGDWTLDWWLDWQGERMKNEATITATKLDGEECIIGKDLERRTIHIRNVWNSRAMVEFEANGLRFEVEGREMITAIQNALNVGVLG